MLLNSVQENKRVNQKDIESSKNSTRKISEALDKDFVPFYRLLQRMNFKVRPSKSIKKLETIDQ